MTSLNRIAVSAVLVVLCSWSVHAQGGSVGDEPPPLDPGGLPGTGPIGQPSDDHSQVCLDSRVIHIGDRLFSEGDPPVQGTFMGEGLAAGFTTDRPIEALALLVNVAGVNTNGAATVRIGSAADAVTRTSGVVLGTLDYVHNNDYWGSPRFAVREAGSYALTVISNPKEFLGVDDFVFGPAWLIYKPADAVVTPVTLTGAGPADVGPTMEYLPQAGTGLDALSAGQATTWCGVWHVAHTGYTMAFLRGDGVGGNVGVVIPITGGGSPVILDTNGTQWVAPGVGGQWRQLTEVCLPFAVAASIPATSVLGEDDVTVGPWNVSFYEDQGVRSLGLHRGGCQILLTEQGQIWYGDGASDEPICFAE